MVYTATASTTTTSTASTSTATTLCSTASNPTATQTPCPETMLKAALEHARRMTAMYETQSIEVAIAWETVEELQAAKARKQRSEQTAFARYCAENPDAPECRIYED